MDKTGQSPPSGTGAGQGRTGAVHKFASALRELHEAAGAPVAAALVRLAGRRHPPLKISPQRLSDWLSGENVPSSSEVVLFLITALQEMASRRGADVTRRSIGAWQELHAAAQRERRHGRGRGGRPRRHLDASEVNTEKAQDPKNAGSDSVGGDLDLRPLYELDPEYLGVHRAFQVAEGRKVVPSYVSRTHDRRLHSVLSEREDGPLFVLIIGGSSTGKTRTAYEALHQEYGNWQVCHPRDSHELSVFLRHRATISETIIWLDEAHQYFGGSVGSDLIQDIRNLFMSRQSALVVATIWPEELERLEPQIKNELNRVAVKIYLPESFSESDLEQARRIAQHDSQIAAVLGGSKFRGLLIQALACGPDLVDRYEHGANVYGRAIISAAMDMRRIGVLPPFDQDLLQKAAAGYLDSSARADPPSDWFDTGLKWACTPVRNAVPALDKARYRPGIGVPDGYELADYLDQYGRQNRKTTIIPGELWEALLAHSVDGAERRQLGTEARRRSLCFLAVEFWRRSDLRPGDREVVHLATLLERAGHLDEAERWLRFAASNADQSARRRLVDFLISHERGETAKAYVRSLAESDDQEAAADLITRFAAAGEPISDTDLPVRPSLTQDIIAELDDPEQLDEVMDRLRYELTALDESSDGSSVQLLHDVPWLIHLLVKHGRGQDGVTELQAAFNRGHKGVGSVLARALSDLGQVEAAIDILAGISGEDDISAWSLLEELFYGISPFEEFLAYHAGHRLNTDQSSDNVKHVYADDHVDDAITLLGDYALQFNEKLDELIAFLIRKDRIDDALRFLAGAAAQGHDYATLKLSELLEEHGSTQEAIETLQFAIDSGHDGFAVRLGRLLLEVGNVAAAQSLIEDRIDRSDRRTSFALALMFQHYGFTPIALEVLRNEAGRGSEAGWQLLLWFHLSRDKTADAEQILRNAATRGSTSAEEELREPQAYPKRLAQNLHANRRAALEAEMQFHADLALQLERVGRIDEALENLKFAAQLESGSEISHRYFFALCKYHRSDEQIKILRRLIEAGGQEEICHLAIGMRSLGALQETADRLRADHPDLDHLDLTVLFHLESVASGPDAGLAVLQQAVDRGDRWARRVLTPLNDRRRRGTYDYPTMLSLPEHMTPVLEALRSQAKAENVAAQIQLASMLEASSYLDEAAMWRRSVADVSPASGERELAGFLERIGNYADSHSARLAAAKAGDYIAMRQMARICEDAHALSEASMWWREAVECGDLRDTLDAIGPDSWVWSDGKGGGGMDSGLARWHEKMGHLDEAQWMLQRSAERPAFEELVQFLQRTGQEDEANRLFSYGIKPGGKTGERW